MIKPARLKEKESCPNKIENHFCIFLLIPIPEKKKKEKKRKKKREIECTFPPNLSPGLLWVCATGTNSGKS